MQDIVNILRTGRHSLVIDSDGIHNYDGRGVSDLYRLFCHEPQLLHGASLADKVVGKGAAAIMVSGGVRSVFAEVISTPAAALLRQAGVEVAYAVEVPYIVNRTGDGRCPLETLCEDCRTADECMPRIAAFVDGLRTGSR